MDFTEFITQSQYIPKWNLPTWIVIITVTFLYFLFLIKGNLFGVNKKKAVLLGLLTVYLLFILCGAVFTREKMETSQIRLELFWSYKWGIQRYGFKIILEIILNILMFMPVGTLFPLIVGKLETKKWEMFFLTILIGLFCSCLVEILQLLLKCGLCELDDIIHNVLGTAAGYGIFVLMRNMQGGVKK